MADQNKSEQEKNSAVQIDSKDLEILRVLQDNSKLTVREIASLVHLSATPVHDRIKRLEKSGVISKYITLIDHQLVNQSIKVICHISIKEHNKQAGLKFIDAMMKHKEIIECYNISGEFDFMLKMVCSSMQAYHQFHMNHISILEGIGQTKTFFVMDIIKETQPIL